MLWNPRRKEPNWGRQVSALLEVLDQKFQKKNKEIVINNFSLIPPGIWKDMRPGSFQVFNLFLLNYILSFNDTLSYLTSKRAIPDLQKVSKPRGEHHAVFTSASRHSLGTEDASDQHGTYEQILMLLNLISSPCLLLIFVYHFKKQAFRIQTWLNKTHFSNGIPQTTLKLNGAISDTVKFLLSRQNTENYITSGTVRQLTIKFPGTSIYLTVVSFAACLPRFELCLDPSLALVTIQVF